MFWQLVSIKVDMRQTNMFLPILCRTTKKLLAPRAIPTHSPIFKLLRVQHDDEFGKYLGRSEKPNCIVCGVLVVAIDNIDTGVQLTTLGRNTELESISQGKHECTINNT
jgi:hypothetical protein